jgi:ABC-type taurine transport system substrate-binding protein
MSALKDRILNSSLDDLVAAAERGEIDPDDVWAEMLASLDRSASLLHDMARVQRDSIDYLDQRLPELSARQDRIDAMIAEWRALAEASDPETSDRGGHRRSKAYRNA